MPNSLGWHRFAPGYFQSVSHVQTNQLPSTGAVTSPAEVLAPPGTRTNVGMVAFRLCRRIVSSAHSIRPDDAHSARLLGFRKRHMPSHLWDMELTEMGCFGNALGER